MLFKKMFILAAILFVFMNGSVSAIDHWWHGGVSADVNDPANWTDRNASNDPTAPGAPPSGTPHEIVRIGASWSSEDLNGNGTLDAGEDLNGNGVIDTHQWALDEPGWGGYYSEDGRGVDLDVDPVLSETYVSRNGDSYGGWWFVLNAPNILTLEDGAYLVMNRDNNNLRNGGRLEVQGRSDEDGPSLVTAKQFRISENGSLPEAEDETSQLIVNGTGWVQVDPWLYSLDPGPAFMIGTSDKAGSMPRGEIVIEDSGRVELAEDGIEEMYLYFGNEKPKVNQIIIRDQGELWLYGDPEAMGRVGTDNTVENADVVSLQDMIDTELIINDQGGSIEIIQDGAKTILKATGLVGIYDNHITSLTYALKQNYPNPFNPTTNIQFQIPNDSYVKLTVYNSLGQPVSTLIDQEMQSGLHQANFVGNELPSGIYFYKLEAGNFMQMNKMILLK